MYPLDEFNRELSVHALDEGWRTAITAATSEAELIHLARNFISNSPPLDLEALPTTCRPRRIVSAGDLSLIAFRLRRAFCSPALDSVTASRVERALAFFEALCDRLFDLRLATLPAVH
jgi:hypothetical protein